MNTAHLRTLAIAMSVAILLGTHFAAAQMPDSQVPDESENLPPIVDRYRPAPAPNLAVHDTADQQAIPLPMPSSVYATRPAYYHAPLMPGMAAPPSVVPAGWEQASCASCGPSEYEAGAMDGDCMMCGGAGCTTCGGAGWGDGCGKYQGYAGQHFGNFHGPFGNGDCCAPRWFDLHAEWLYWQRQDISRLVNFSSDGITGPIVLSTDDLSFQNESGFRISGAYVVAPSTNLEVSYFGTFSWASAATVTSATDNLYSVFSQFGTVPFNGFLETDQAFSHRIDYTSELNNGEVNWRHRWISANCLVHGSWLVGARYLRLSEDFKYDTLTDGGFLDYVVVTKNNLVGAQLGADVSICMSPRLKIGAEIEAGVYGNSARQVTDVVATTVDPSIVERVSGGDVAFVGEAGFMGLLRITPRLALRGGYQLLYLNGVALAAENFNADPPFFGRTPFLNDNGEAFYHGGTLGFEWIW